MYLIILASITITTQLLSKHIKTINNVLFLQYHVRQSGHLKEIYTRKAESVSNHIAYAGWQYLELLNTGDTPSTMYCHDNFGIFWDN